MGLCTAGLCTGGWRGYTFIIIRGGGAYNRRLTVSNHNASWCQVDDNGDDKILSAKAV